MPKPKYTTEIFKDKKGEFRLRVIHRNGKILFQTSEGYKRKSAMLKTMQNFIVASYTGNIAISDLTLKIKK